MSEKDRNIPKSNEAVEKIIGNMTAEMQNVDGQYVPLAFTPPPAPPSTSSDSLNWPQTSNSFINNYNSYSTNSDISLGYVPLDQFNQLNHSPYNYIQQPHHLFNMNDYKKSIDLYDTIGQNGSNDTGLFASSDCLLGSSNLRQSNVEHPLIQPHTQLIENLVGNWVPNISGTYSPFGNVDHYNHPSGISPIGVFDKTTDITEQSSTSSNNVIRQILDEPNLISGQPQQQIDDRQQFNQFTINNGNNVKKTRMVAEVKPMRPSYSDVLTKSVPQTTVKQTKNDLKEVNKIKKDNNKKSNKSNEKMIKINNHLLNRSNTNNDIKDIPTEKINQFVTTNGNKTVEKTNQKINKNSQLNRKWASLDNINEPTKNDESRKKKSDDNHNKSFPKVNFKKVSRNSQDITEVDLGNGKNESINNSKNGLKKINKFNNRPKNLENNGNERPPGKRNQRTRKRENHVPFGVVGQKLRYYLKGWWKYIVVFLLWFINLISDICSLSIHISRDMALNFWAWLRVHWFLFIDSSIAILRRIRIFTWLYEKFKKKDNKNNEKNRSFLHHNGLQNNINMPTTGDEAMKRLLACKGKDPYSILGVTPNCTDDDIKRYYKKQAFLVHPDKNQQPGAEEAFKILVHAFDMIGEPERRAAYDKGVVESVQMEQARSELIDLLDQLQQKVEAAANTIRCSSCGMRHKRIKVDRPSYAARNCSSCKIHHAAREGDIWAEARCFGFLWHYYACMEGGVYDITEWAGCQKDSLKHLKPDSHQVQYRIALGKQQQNNYQNSRKFSGSSRNNSHDKPPDLENLLNTLYGQADMQQGQGNRRKSKKANK